MADEVLKTTCCIVGGGPAGVMLGYLLARQGVPVAVLEKHADFLRDFRGDTVHPSTLEVLKELGLLDEFLQLPHQKVQSAGVIIGDTAFEVADFRHVPQPASSSRSCRNGISSIFFPVTPINFPRLAC